LIAFFAVKSSIKDGDNQDLRADLMSAVDEVTNAMANVVTELTRNRTSAEENNNAEEESSEDSWNVNSKINITSSSVVTTNTQVSVY